MRSRIGSRISWLATMPTRATLEITLLGPELVVEADTTMAIAGAHFEVACDDRPVALNASFTVQRGQRIKFGRIVEGARAYLAVAGGIQTDPVLGSRATHLVSHMGGFKGRALMAGDRVPIAGDSSASAREEVRRADAADQGPRAASSDGRPSSRLVRGRCA